MAALALTAPLAAAQQNTDIPIIPLPARVVHGAGSFQLSAGTMIEAQRGRRGAFAAARYLKDMWSRSNGLKLATAKLAGAPPIVFRFESGMRPEAYRLEVTPERVTVSATTAAGFFYGAVTLSQLVPPGVLTALIPTQTIVDEPRYAWRGLLLDSARHFQSAAFVRSMIDWMAWHKLNVLHWHLTDDQGWRLQILRYPRLTSVGGWRIPAVLPGAPEPPPYGGFYSQAEVRDIVAFAATRHVLVVPEIDMPAHAQAAIAAYPALGSTDGAPLLPVSSKWGVHSHLFNLEPATFTFLEHVLDEVMQLFPSKFIHIGGDEAVKDEWKASRLIQTRARLLGSPDENALQTYFTQRIIRYVTQHGRRAIGWDEIMQPGLAGNALVMAWHGDASAREAAKEGFDTILTPDPALYFDHRQSSLPSEPPGRMAPMSLRDVYRFEPHDAALPAAEQRHILGLQAQLWTEHINSERRLEWMALPRAAAVAEIGWSWRRDWASFLRRLAPTFARYRAFDIDYADSVFGIDPHIAATSAGLSVTLTNLPALQEAAIDSSIHFTLDGGDPSADSLLYTEPFGVTPEVQLRAATFVGTQRVSRTWSARVDLRSGSRRSSNELELCSNAVGLLLEPEGRESSDPPLSQAPLAVDIMNPCWILRGVELGRGADIRAAVAPLPFNYELGADAAKIRVGDNRTAEGELEIHVDGCDGPAVVTLPLPPAAQVWGVSELPAQRLSPLTGRHDICLRFARPRLDPLWALDWIEMGA